MSCCLRCWRNALQSVNGLWTELSGGISMLLYASQVRELTGHFALRIAAHTTSLAAESVLLRLLDGKL